ncbi:MAG: PilZ domain-containing protein [Terriglobales bacterium]
MDPITTKRAALRFPVRCQIHCDTGDQTFLAESFDLSEDGMSFVTGADLPVNSEALLQYRLQPDDPLITVRVLVRYRQGDRIGVQFLDLHHEHREMIKRRAAGT